MPAATATCVLCGDGISPEYANLPAPCECSVCPSCIYSSTKAALDVPLPPVVPKPVGVNGASAPEFSKGQDVLYRSREGIFLPAKVAEVDLSCLPAQYGVRLDGVEHLRFTEAPRLLSFPAASQPQCPSCSVPYSNADVQRLAPKANEEAKVFAAQRLRKWLARHGVMQCPHADCGVLYKPQPPLDEEDGEPQPPPGSCPKCKRVP